MTKDDQRRRQQRQQQPEQQQNIDNKKKLPMKHIKKTQESVMLYEYRNRDLKEQQEALRTVSSPTGPVCVGEDASVAKILYNQHYDQVLTK